MTKADCLRAGYYDSAYFYTLQKGDSVFFVDRETHKTVAERVTLHDKDGHRYYEWR